MPIDSSIYQNIQVQPQYNALDQYAKQQQLQHVVGQNDLAQLLLQDKQREIQDAGEVRNFTRQSGGDPNKLKEALFGAGRYKEGMVIDEMLGKRRKEAADLSKLQSEAGSKRLQLYREAMPEIKTPEDAAGWVRSQYSDPHLSDIMASRGSLDQAIARIPQDPAGLTRWMQQNALGMDKFIEKNKPSIHMQNIGGIANVIGVSGLGGVPTTLSSTPMTQSPDNAATIANAAQQGNLNRGVTMRGQNLQDARENLVPLETPTGYQAFSKKTGTAIPIMSGGQQLQQKDSPLVANQKLQGQLGAGIEEARKLIPLATASGAGALADTAMGFVGKSTKGGDAAQQLETLAGWMTSNVPRMQGPQSDKDVLLYKQMAAEVGNRNKPVSARMAALDTLEKLQAKYADVNGTVQAPNNMSPTKANAAKINSMDMQAAEWAKANPNDPRAAAIKQRLGL